MESKLSFPLITFTLMALVSYAFWQLRIKSDVDQAIEPFTKGYALKQVEMDITDKNGEITTHITAPEMIYYDEQAVLVMTQPNVIFTTTPEEKWFFSAPIGQYDEDTGALLFAETVNLRSQSNQAEVEPIEIDTSDLTVYPGQEIATTESKITINQGTMAFAGDGATIHLNEKEFRIKRNVKAEFNR